VEEGAKAAADPMRARKSAVTFIFELIYECDMMCES